MNIFHRKRKKLSTDTLRNGVKLITDVDPKDIVSEQFRTVRTNINFSAVNQKLKTIIFTSSAVSEGKSTVSANLAVIWAQQGQKTLFIDSDLRRPTLHTTFGLLNTNGLSTALSTDTDFNSVVQKTEIDNLSVITSGPIPPNPSDLLASNRMKELISYFKKIYDVIILDVPPLLSVTDTQIIAAQVDGVVLVVRQGLAQKLAIKRSTELLKMVKANLLGYVLNDVAPKNGYGYGYGYGYDNKSK
jgi:capsular exopolysaccharide synthesis family protein